MSHDEAAIANAFRAACRAELEALKPGNVHVHSPGHGMTVADFLVSAEAAAPAIARAGAGVGARVLAAVEATRAACGQNTNLGIVLLAAPLAAAAEGSEGTRARLRRVLARLTVEDADLAFRAIRLAAPAGLGRSDRHDVADPPAVTLLEAMRAAANRDRIAFQYANGFRDVLELGVPRLRRCRAEGWTDAQAVSAVYLGFLACFPDSHVVRKHGSLLAEKVRRRAAALEALLGRTDGHERCRPQLLAWDGELKARGLNPGTSADLTVASHFAAALFA